ncbi:hypothetical protein BU198_13315 [Streptomyces sp. CBMA156]|nr:hypothetical protein [Streptomyces sp. CBMA156]
MSRAWDFRALRAVRAFSRRTSAACTPRSSPTPAPAAVGSPLGLRFGSAVEITVLVGVPASGPFAAAWR